MNLGLKKFDLSCLINSNTQQDSPLSASSLSLSASSLTFNQVNVPSNKKLKRNIFANVIIQKKNSIILQKQQSNQYNDFNESDLSLNVLQNEPIYELMITELEQKIYDQLDLMGVRLADPMEISSDYYQKIRSNIFMLSEKCSERFLTNKLKNNDKYSESMEDSFIIRSTDRNNIECINSNDLQFDHSSIYVKRQDQQNSNHKKQNTK